jgi:extracellular elastinolytic metalloproteinase
LPFFDVRAAGSARAVAAAGSAQRTSEAIRDARNALSDDLGRQGIIDVDPVTGTARQVTKLDGALSGPSGRARRDIALSFARRNARALGLSDPDFDTLRADGIDASRTGLGVVRWRQTVDGIPAFDNGLRVALDRAGRVLQVAGSPLHAPSLPTTTPQLSAEDALRALQRSAGEGGGVRATGGADGAERDTTFSDGSRASLVAFDDNGTLRLAWNLFHQASSTAYYHAVLDAQTGRVLYRANLVKAAAPADIFAHYPGAVNGGGTVATNIDGYLYSPSTTTMLSGLYAHAFADVNDDNTANVGEEVDTHVTHHFTPFGTCGTNAVCSWNGNSLGWQANRDQNAVQAFWFVNNFHDHLKNDPNIGFTAASGNFEGSDAVVVNTDDGASGDDTGFPDSNHINNANMSTPPDGQAPRMQMYLFLNSVSSPFRNINGGDTAEIVYHEYTHGLSSRLITNDDGSAALNGPQAGAMGEAWSDWYALDYLATESDGSLVTGGANLITDSATDGEIDMGAYTDASPNQLRTQPLDCPVPASAPACPRTGSALTGAGGYTYGQFGKVVSGGPEVHADGEIWGETLWDLRTALGSAVAEELITDAMRISPPEPSFLDMRNAIVAADTNASGGANRAVIWDVFAHRGMGFFAGTINGDDTAPIEDVSMPPSGGATGTIGGRVTDADTGQPVSGIEVGIGGHTTVLRGADNSADNFAGTSGADGGFSFSGVPVGTYAKLFAQRTKGYDELQQTNVTVSSAATTTTDFAIRRDWAALAGGATVTTNDDTGAPVGCGGAAVADQSRGVGWSPHNPTSPEYPQELTGAAPQVTIKLPVAVDVKAFGVDPSSTCGDGPSASTKSYRIETSSDGSTFATASSGSFSSAQLATLTPNAGTGSNVRYVRLTLLAPQDDGPGSSGRDFIDFTELEVFGTPTAPPSPAAPPSSTLAPAPTPSATPAPAKPSFTVSRVTGGLRLSVLCASRCTAKATLTLSKAMAHRLHLRRRTVRTLTSRLAKGRHTVTIRLASSLRRTAKRAHLRRLALTLKVTIRDAVGRTTTSTRRVQLRI